MLEEKTASRKYTGVILAAGKGSRMAPFGEHYPKPILPVCNKPLIQYQVEIMRRQGITEIVILVGHKGYEITKVLGDGSQLGVRLRYVEQSSALGIAHAVGRLEAHINHPFLLFLGDIFFDPGPVNEMFEKLEEQGGGAVLAVKEEEDTLAIRKNYSLLLNDEGFVARVIEKPRHVRTKLKGVGLYLFDLTIFDAIRRTPRTAMRDEYEITDAIQILIEDGYPVRPSLSIIDDINLTTPADLLFCNLLEARRATPAALRGAESFVHDDAVLTRCIVGRNAAVTQPVAMSDSVVFDNTSVAHTGDLSYHILTPENRVDCRPDLTAAQWSRLR